MLVLLILGCSKDHSAPTFSEFSVAKKPTNIIATYNKTLDVVKVTWTMQDTTGVVDYYVSISDSSDFDYGNVATKVSNSRDQSYNFAVNQYLPATTDSTILYFNVSAIYDNTKLQTFIGPRSDKPDSAMIKRK